MTLYTIGFTQKTAKQFFELIRINKINVLLDIRLNNKSQLAGFTKGEDLEYFLFEISRCRYEHCLQYAPTKEILDDYRKKRITWNEYVERYNVLMNERNNYHRFFDAFSEEDHICLLCSEPTAERCHRRVLAEMIIHENPDTVLKHL